MTEYDYTKKTTRPALDQIRLDVAASLMSDKKLSYMRWDQETAILKIFWGGDLSAGDKTILDGIVAANS